MLRTASFALKFSNAQKRAQLTLFVSEYISVVNFYIEQFWAQKVFGGSYVPKDVQVSSSSWISQRAKQCAGKQALQAVKSQRKKKNKTMPVVMSRAVELDSRFVTFLDLDTSFDELVKFGSLGNRLSVVCPIKHHKHYNGLLKKGFKRKGSTRLREYNGNLYLDVFLERDFLPKNTNRIIGIDLGIKKLMVDSDGNEYGKDIDRLLEKSVRKQQGSKAFYRALRERDNYINRTVKELPESNYVLEDLKGIHKDTKKRLRKQFRSKLHRWTYSALLKRIALRAEVVGVQCRLVSPYHTSQACSACGYVHKSNRKAEIFSCRNCGYESDADFNASRNILNRFDSRAYSPWKEEKNVS
jgi:IS605 OrfB family transposase